MITDENLKIYRKRFIPPECILLRDDVVVSCSEDTVVTKWSTLRPKSSFHHGASCYFLKKGFKLSKYYRSDNSLLYWYCDIVDFSYDRAEHALTVTDLLADVIIYPDGQMKIVDLDELAEAFEQGVLPPMQLSMALRQLDGFLSLAYRGQLGLLQETLDLAGL